MNSDKFIWTSEDYTCSELREKFDNKFPVIALVTHGYYGEKDQEAISAETIMRIHDWGLQQRVVAKDHRGRFITMPSTYPLKIQQLLKTLEPVGKYMTIQEFLNNNILPKTAQMDKDEVGKLYTGDRIEMFGPLELIHTYTEKFFKSTIFRGGSLAVENTYIIPMHVEMRFKIALGMKASSADDWSQWLNSVNQVANRVDFTSLSGIPDIFVYNKEAAGWDFNTELPEYHVRHPLTLKKGMDRYSWNMCIISPRRDGGWTKPTQPAAGDGERPKFNQTTGMKQPTLSPAVHSELMAKLKKGPTKKEMVSSPGDFAARHKMLQSLFQGSREQSPTQSPLQSPPQTAKPKEPVRRRTPLEEDAVNKVQVREKRKSKEVNQERPMSGEYDTRLIPQEDNQIYGSHVPKPRGGDVRQDQSRSGHRSRENMTRDHGRREKPSRVADPMSYQYGGRELSPRRGGEGDRRERERYDERHRHADREMSPRRGSDHDRRRQHPNQQSSRVGGPESYEYGGRRQPQGQYSDELDGRRGRDPRGRHGPSRIGEVESYQFSGPGGDRGTETRSNRDYIESFWPKRKFSADTFADMTPEQVVECLQDLDLGEHGQRFLDIGVDGLILMNLTKDDLRRDFDITGFQATRLLKFAREGWKT